MIVDYLVVGSGLTGATIARLLWDTGRDVAILERRPCFGGNVHDFLHPSGIRIHTYGPHYFRTSSERIWAFMQRFARFYPFEAVVMTRIDGRLEHWPLHADFVERLASQKSSRRISEPANFEDAVLSMMPSIVYKKAIEGYTAKQWGVAPRSLEVHLASRFDLRVNGDIRLKPSKHQGLPENGYAGLIDAMLEGIPAYTCVDYNVRRSDFSFRKLLVYTGPIDEYFNYEFGKLAYRAQHREHIYLPDTAWFQPAVQVNEPDINVPFIRTIEWKHMEDQRIAAARNGTVITTETPYSPENSNDYEYPFPDTANRQMYARYRERLIATKGVLACGRLGEYRYLDMDQAIGRAMMIADRILCHVEPWQLPKEINDFCPL